LFPQASSGYALSIAILPLKLKVAPVTDSQREALGTFYVPSLRLGILQLQMCMIWLREEIAQQVRAYLVGSMRPKLRLVSRTHLHLCLQGRTNSDSFFKSSAKCRFLAGEIERQQRLLIEVCS
jgi:hypothetical protein